ncbi:hypothetical protein H2203_002589 [Taxawa tesnikishii (nom. ined.)]|nr:hypothetical protein H2203_002589 [Dothideales sp. JES 119]
MDAMLYHESSATEPRRQSICSSSSPWTASFSDPASSHTVSPVTPSTPFQEEGPHYVNIHTNGSFLDGEAIANNIANSGTQTPERNSVCHQSSHHQSIDDLLNHTSFQSHTQATPGAASVSAYATFRTEMPGRFCYTGSSIPDQHPASIGLTPSLFSNFSEPNSAFSSTASSFVDLAPMGAAVYHGVGPPSLPPAEFHATPTRFVTPQSLAPSQVLPIEHISPEDAWEPYDVLSSSFSSDDSYGPEKVEFCTPSPSPVGARFKVEPHSPHRSSGFPFSVDRTPGNSRAGRTSRGKKRQRQRQRQSKENAIYISAAQDGTAIEQKEKCMYDGDDGTPCPAAFDRSEHLNRHILSVHKKERKYHCPLPNCKQPGISRLDNCGDHFKSHLKVRRCGPQARNAFYEWDVFARYLAREWEPHECRKMMEKLEKWRRGEKQKNNQNYFSNVVVRAKL